MLLWLLLCLRRRLHHLLLLLLLLILNNLNLLWMLWLINVIDRSLHSLWSLWNVLHHLRLLHLHILMLHHLAIVVWHLRIIDLHTKKTKMYVPMKKKLNRFAGINAVTHLLYRLSTESIILLDDILCGHLIWLMRWLLIDYLLH